MRRVGKESFNTTCNNCGAVMTTQVHQDTGVIAWIAAGKVLIQQDGSILIYIKYL